MTREHVEPNPCQETDCLLPGGWVFERDRKLWRPANPDDVKHRKCWAHGPGKERPDVIRRSKRAQPNARIQISAAILLAEAREATKALEWIHDELSVLGFPGTTGTGGTPTDEDGPGSRAEAEAIRVYQLTAWREDYRDRIGEVESAVLNLRKLRQRITGKPTAEDEPLCRDKQKGREGYDVPRADGGWADATCTELPTIDGLCPKCYQAERRWRRAAGLLDRKADTAA